MALTNVNPTTTAAWALLQKHFEVISKSSIKELFENDAQRGASFQIKWNAF